MRSRFVPDTSHFAASRLPVAASSRRQWLKWLSAAAAWPLAACQPVPSPPGDSAGRAGPVTGSTAATAAAPIRPVPATGLAGEPPIEVWKTPTCGCCRLWVEHLQSQGWTVVVNDVPDTSGYRQRAGIPVALGSCHTAQVAGYALEGHVPAADIRRLLVERPDAIGLAVPSMPVGSPGMEQGSQRDPFDVLLVQRDGTTRIFSAYRT